MTVDRKKSKNEKAGFLLTRLRVRSFFGYQQSQDEEASLPRSVHRQFFIASLQKDPSPVERPLSLSNLYTLNMSKVFTLSMSKVTLILFVQYGNEIYRNTYSI
jgi:hypothetical protein